MAALLHKQNFIYLLYCTYDIYGLNLNIPLKFNILIIKLSELNLVTQQIYIFINYCLKCNDFDKYKV